MLPHNFAIEGRIVCGGDASLPDNFVVGGTKPTGTEISVCASNADCSGEIMNYTKLVTSGVDCYCRSCDTASLSLNKATYEAYKASWQTQCKSWSDQTCPMFKCPSVPTRACIDGQCKVGVGGGLQ